MIRTQHQKQRNTAGYQRRVRRSARLNPLTNMMQHLAKIVTLAGVTLDNQQLVVDEYMRWLHLQLCHPDPSQLSPTVLMDTIWHLHITDTKHYESHVKLLSETVAKSVRDQVHHDPLRSTDPEDVKQKRRHAAAEFYHVTFGHDPPTVFDLWSLPIQAGQEPSFAEQMQEQKHSSVSASASPAIATAGSSAPSGSNSSLYSINIHVLSGHLYPIEVANDTSVLELKERIQEATGVPVNHQVLFFVKRRRDLHYLDDELKMSHYHIVEGCIVDMVARRPQTTASSTGASTKDAAAVAPTATVGGAPAAPPAATAAATAAAAAAAAAAVVETPSGPSMSEICIFVCVLDGTTYMIEVEYTANISEFKRLVQKASGIPACQQCLIYNGRQLSEGLRIDHYRIQNCSTVHLTLQLRGC